MQSEPLVYTERVTGPRELATKLKFLATQQNATAYTSYSDDKVQLDLTVTLTAITIAGETTAGSWHPSPGLSDLPTPNVDAVVCAVCQGDTRHRRHLYIVDPHKKEGQWVGSACAAADRQFRKAKTPEPFHWLHQTVRAYPTERTYDTTRVVAEALHHIRRFGYVPASHATEPPTRDRVEAALTSPPSADVEQLYLEAQMLLLVTADIEPDSEFLHSLQYSAALSEVTRHSIGVLCFLPEFHERARVAQLLPDDPNEYVGQPGERLTRDLVFCESRILASGMPILKFADAETGARLTWFSRGRFRTPEPGQRVTASFTVRRHEVYRNRRSTVVTRMRQVGN